MSLLSDDDIIQTLSLYLQSIQFTATYMVETEFLAVTGRPAFFIVLAFLILSIFPLVYYLLTLIVP